MSGQEPYNLNPNDDYTNMNDSAHKFNAKKIHNEKKMILTI